MVVQQDSTEETGEGVVVGHVAIELAFFAELPGLLFDSAPQHDDPCGDAEDDRKSERN